MMADIRAGTVEDVQTGEYTKTPVITLLNIYHTFRPKDRADCCQDLADNRYTAKPL